MKKNYYNKSYHRAYYIRNKQKFLDRMKRIRTEDPRAERNKKLQSSFGISVDDYDRMLREQNGVCAICRRHETIRSNKSNKIKRLTVDHDHSTGKVRGLVCQKCNSILGYANDDPCRLLIAADYLEKYSA